jgi:hypothetical protein
MDGQRDDATIRCRLSIRPSRHVVLCRFDDCSEQPGVYRLGTPAVTEVVSGDDPEHVVLLVSAQVNTPVDGVWLGASGSLANAWQVDLHAADAVLAPSRGCLAKMPPWKKTIWTKNGSFVAGEPDDTSYNLLHIATRVLESKSVAILISLPLTRASIFAFDTSSHNSTAFRSGWAKAPDDVTRSARTEIR